MRRDGRDRARAASLAMVLAAAGVAIAGLRCGPGDVSWDTIARVALAETGLSAEAAASVSRPEVAIVWHIRLPRLLGWGLVGASLSLSGALLQGVFRNPLASPEVIGVSAGAALGATAAIAAGLAAVSALAVPLAAFGGALVAAFLVYALATRGGHAPVTTLVLCGIAVNATASAGVSLVLGLTLYEWEAARQIVAWLMGGLAHRTWSEVLLVAPPLVLCTAAASRLSRDLDLLALGEVSARALGVDVPRATRLALSVAAAAAGSAVAVAGSIGFVGLVVPHVMRLLVGPEHGRLLPASLAAGAIFLPGMELLARGLPLDTGLRVGVLTAGVGGPFFLYLVLRERRRGELA